MFTFTEPSQDLRKFFVATLIRRKAIAAKIAQRKQEIEDEQNKIQEEEKERRRKISENVEDFDFQENTKEASRIGFINHRRRRSVSVKDRENQEPLNLEISIKGKASYQS